VLLRRPARRSHRVLCEQVEETPKRLQHVLQKAHALHRTYTGGAPTHFELNPASAEFQRLSVDVLAAERLVLQATQFDLTVAHPYKFLLATVKAIPSFECLTPAAAAAATSRAPGALAGAAAATVAADGTPLDSSALRKLLAQNAWNFVNDSLRTTLCLQVCECARARAVSSHLRACQCAVRATRDRVGGH
jgi:hypothetical protein